MNRATQVILLAVILVLGSVPMWPTLGYAPMTADPGVWIGAGATSSAGWLDWVFASDHFAWYRPLPALSFSLNQLVGGHDPLGYRLVDLVLHLGVIAVTFALARQLRPSAPVTAIIAAALVAAHAGTNEVVPFMARRSYSMGMLAALGGLVVLTSAVRRPGGASLGHGVLVALCFVAGVYSNEGTIVVIALAPFVAWLVTLEAGRPHREWLMAAIPSVVLLALALLWRHQVLGGIGGYSEEAYADNTHASVWNDSSRLLLATPNLARILGEGEWIGIVVLAVGGLLALRGTVLAFVRRDDPGERLVLVLTAWVVLNLALFAVTRSWFARQIYLVIPPLALLAALMIEQGLRNPRVPRLAALPAVLVLLGLLATSPVLHGQPGWRRSSWQQRDAVIRHLLDGLEGVDGPARVALALPNLRPKAGSTGNRRTNINLPRSVHQPLDWARLVVGQSEIELVDLLYFPLDAASGTVTLATEGGRPRFALAPSADVLERQGPTFSRITTTQREVRVSELPGRVAPDYLLLVTTEGHELVQVDGP